MRRDCAVQCLGVWIATAPRSGGSYSDGARILRLLRADAKTDGEVALLTLTGLSLGGTRPRDWDAALVARGAAGRDGGPFEVGGLYFAYAHALDRGDIPAARSSPGHPPATAPGAGRRTRFPAARTRYFLRALRQ